MRYAIILLSGSLLFLYGCATDSSPTEGKTEVAETANQKSDVEPAPDQPVEGFDGAATPEIALRQFLVAVSSLDYDSLEQVSLPDPALKLLVAGKAPSQEQQQQMIDHFTNVPIQRLHAGQRVELPGGKSLTISEQQDSDLYAMMTFPDNPVPFEVVLKGNGWKVNPGMLLAARKAALAAQQAQSEKQ